MTRVKAEDLVNMDKRVAERLIRSGDLDEEVWKRHLESLPDSAEKAEEITAEFETGVLKER